MHARQHGMEFAVKHGLSADIVVETKRFWEERTGERVSDEDAREAIRNVTAFIDLLAQWDAKERGDEVAQAPGATAERPCPGGGSMSCPKEMQT